MLKKLILAVALIGLFGATAGTASAQGYGRRAYCPRPYYHNSFRPSYGGVYGYRGPSTYFGPEYGFRTNSGYRGYGGYGYGGYGYGGSGISIRIGF
jgi:hypothetical protein